MSEHAIRTAIYSRENHALAPPIRQAESVQQCSHERKGGSNDPSP